jgi:hypothetical protein
MQNNLTIVNVDTDSFMVCKPNGNAWSKAERELFISEVNSEFPELIRWEDDGYYSSVVVIKSKNYALLPEGETKIKLKGSSIKDQKKEPALREMMNRIIEIMIMDEDVDLVDVYNTYVKEAVAPTDIRRWCQKKTASESVLNCKGYEGMEDDDDDSPRKNESDIWDAIKAEEGVQQGDKIYLYPVYLGKKEYEEKKYKKNKETGEREFNGYTTKQKDVYGLRLDKYYNNDIATEKLVKRVYDTMKIFESIVDISLFPKYHNKGNKELLEKLNNAKKD